MKIGKLYLKIFLYFILILVVTEILIFGFFRFAVIGRTGNRFAPSIRAHTFVLKELIEDRINREPDKPLAENQSLLELLIRLDQLYNARIWITSQDNRVLVRSFEGEAAVIYMKRMKRLRHFYVNRYASHFISIPLDLPGNEEGFLNLDFKRIENRHMQRPFAIGLVLIGLAIALLLLPVSRYITRPLEGLRQSVLRIADGDLSGRATAKGKDEIGDLVKAFNSMAEKIERMVIGMRELTANISHELRSPLARIRVEKELLMENLEKLDKVEFERHLKSVEDEIEEMDRLIGQVLKLSKLDVKKGSKKMEEVDITEIARGLIKKFSQSIQHKYILLEMDIPQKPILLYSDHEDIQVALSNLLDNAVKFTPHYGKIEFRILKRIDGIEITIFNNHEPLYEEDLKRIFEPFYRVKKSEASGTGLGLSITKKIIENHNGLLEASQVENGLKMRIMLYTDNLET